MTDRSNALSHVHRGFGSVRPYLHGPDDLPDFLERTFGAVVLETNPDGPTLLQIGDSLVWVEAGELPSHITPWVGSVYVYVEDVDAVYSRAIELGARSISAPEDKPYHERQAGFVDSGGNTGGCRNTWVRLDDNLRHEGLLKGVVHTKWFILPLVVRLCPI